MIDAHCHLANLAAVYNISRSLETATARGINGWISCSQNREEVRWHQLNRDLRIKIAAGIHPFYKEGNALQINDLEQLAKEKQLVAIGEIGFDKRNRDLTTQVQLLKDQLSLARMYDLPCVFHVVGHLDVFFKILSDLPVRGIWHGFYASKEVVKQFSKFDLAFSIGPTMVNSLKHEIVSAVLQSGNYLLETDAPHNVNQSEHITGDSFNPLIELVNYARVVSRLGGVKLESLQYDLDNNIRQYFR